MLKKLLSMISAGACMWMFGASAQENEVAKNWLEKSKAKVKTEKPLDFVVCEAGN